MLKASIIVILFIVTVIVFLFVLGVISRSGSSPGLLDGKLTRCPDRPNCVCSEYSEDTDHYATPIIPANKIDDHVGRLKAVLQEIGGNIIIEKDNYLATTFTSALFGFVDDLEIRLDKGKNIIHFRSASRVGYSDLSVNRKRIGLLKSKLSDFS